jgi:serine/threonine protein kinase
VSAPADVVPAVGADLRELVGARVLDWVGEGWEFAGYRIEQVIGSGGMAVAFLVRVEEEATDRPGRPPAGTRCVLKVLLPGVVIREAKVAQLSFKKEVIALSRLAEKIPPSPFVVRYLDAGVLPVMWAESRDGERRQVHLPWCAVELVDGRPLGTTLDERLEIANGPLEPARAAALIEGIVRGLRAVHAVGLVHRDLKPSNVLVCGEPPNELPKITDFGVARAAGMGDTFDVSVGTSGYAALEQLEGPRPGKKNDQVGTWSDVFSLGAIIYEILARAPMYEAPSAMQYVGKVLARNFDRLATRTDMGAAWSTPEGRALAARWDEVLLRATSPRSPGGGAFAADVMPMRHRDVEELFDDLEPLLDATRALGGRSSRPIAAPSVVRVHENVVSWKRWEWTLGGAAPEPLIAAAIRADGVAVGATHDALFFWNGERWSAIAGRKSSRPEDEPVGVLQGGAGTFVVVRRGGEVDVMPGGGGAFSLRLPFAVKRATSLAGHPLGTAWIAAHAAHGDWVVLRMHGRVASQIARLGANAPIDAIIRAPVGEDELLVVGGSALDRRGPEAMVATIDRNGRVAALPPIPGPAVHALAVDADGNVVVAGPGGAGRIDLVRASLAVDDMASISPATAIDALVALADGQVWGFSCGVAMRRGTDRMWRRAHAEPALEKVPVLAAAASGARVWSVHQDGRVLAGRLMIGEI